MYTYFMVTAPTKKRLTRKQKGFVKDTVEGKTGVAAALNNYDTDDYRTANAIAVENLQKPAIINAIQDALPDDLLAARHLELLNASDIDHMVFPLNMMDEDITDLLKENNCTPKRFMHSETQTHVWFFSADNKARKDAIDMAYKIKGSYAPEKRVNANLNVTANVELDADIAAAAAIILKDKKT
jgi:hypothetical protein